VPEEIRDNQVFNRLLYPLKGHYFQHIFMCATGPSINKEYIFELF
jgi:hypothetical protein